MNDQTRPEGWVLPDHSKVIKNDYYGQPYEAYERINRGPDYGKLWQQFSEDFRSQEQHNPGHNSYNPPLDQIEYRELNP